MDCIGGVARLRGMDDGKSVSCGPTGLVNGNPDHIVDALTGYTITLDLNMVSPGWSADGTQVEHLRFADGTVWNSEQMRAAAELERSVSLMVQAMATFAVPAPGLVTATALDDRSRLAPVLAASWG